MTLRNPHMKARYDRLRSAGLCVGCGAEPAAKPRRRCVECLEKNHIAKSLSDSRAFARQPRVDRATMLALGKLDLTQRAEVESIVRRYVRACEKVKAPMASAQQVLTEAIDIVRRGEVAPDGRVLSYEARDYRRTYQTVEK